MLIVYLGSLEVHNAKFRKLVGKDAKPDTMESELEGLSRYEISGPPQLNNSLTLRYL
jgi:hypothetical protein